jgi:molybdopterin molybdotransferase
MALGLTRVGVSRQPRVAVLSSGDEVISPDAPVQPGQVRDVNSYSLSALVEQAGGLPRRYGILPDQEEVLRSTLAQALRECDMVIITAGSSASARDLTSQAIQASGSPGVLVHGVNLRPGKPTILAICDEKPVIGLPGNPVSALVVARLFVVPILAYMLGASGNHPPAMVVAKLTTNLASQAGREEWIPARLISGAQGYLAEPIFFKSNLIFSLARADGLIFIPADATGTSAGEQVQVYLLS